MFKYIVEFCTKGLKGHSGACVPNMTVVEADSRANVTLDLKKSFKPKPIHIIKMEKW